MAGGEGHLRNPKFGHEKGWNISNEFFASAEFVGKSYKI